MLFSCPWLCPLLLDQQVLSHCLALGYSQCFLANNDVLIGPGTVGALSSALATGGADLAVPLTRKGAGDIL